MNETYLFIVSGDNIALGVFRDMDTAVRAVRVSDPGAVKLELGEWHATYWSPKERTVLNVVACRPSSRPESMF